MEWRIPPRFSQKWYKSNGMETLRDGMHHKLYPIILLCYIIHIVYSDFEVLFVVFLVHLVDFRSLLQMVSLLPIPPMGYGGL